MITSNLATVDLIVHLITVSVVEFVGLQNRAWINDVFLFLLPELALVSSSYVKSYKENNLVFTSSYFHDFFFILNFQHPLSPLWHGKILFHSVWWFGTPFKTLGLGLDWSVLVLRISEDAEKRKKWKKTLTLGISHYHKDLNSRVFDIVLKLFIEKRKKKTTIALLCYQVFYFEVLTTVWQCERKKYFKNSGEMRR